MDPADEKTQEILATWLVEKAEVLPSRAKAYANLIVTAGIGSISRLSKKLKKCPSLLIDLGFDEDDADEILTLLSTQDSMVETPHLPKESHRIYEARFGVPDPEILRNSILLRALGLEPLKNFFYNPDPSVWGVGDLILPARMSVDGLEKIALTDATMPRSASHSSLSATSFDRAMESLNEKRHSISQQVSNQIAEPSSRKLPIRTSALSPSLVMSKEHMEIASSALALVSKFAGYESRDNLEVISLLREVINLAEKSSDKHFFLNCLSQLELCKTISFILSFFLNSSDTCIVVCECISLLCQCDDDRKTINLENIEEFGFYGTCDILSQLFLSLLAIEIQSADICLIQAICIAIAKLSHLEQNILDFVNFGVCDRLSELVEYCLKRHEIDSDILRDVLVCARNLSQHENAVERFLKVEFEHLIIRVLLDYSRDELFSINAIRVIIMLGNSPNGPNCLGIAGACNAVVLCMTGNDGRASVVEWALMAIEMLLLVENNLPLLLQTSICEVLIYCLEKNLQIASIARGSARVVQMLAADQLVRTKLGASSACEVFARTLHHHMVIPSISQACCGAIGSLAADHELNRVTLIKYNAGKYIVETLQKYSSSDGIRNVIPSGYDTVIWQACWALRKLANGGNATVELEEVGVCEALAAVGRRYIESTDIMIQVFRLLNTLSTQCTSKTLLRRIGSSGLYKTILKCLAKHSANSVIARIGVESLCYVASGPENIEKLLNARACEIIVEILEIHSGSESELTMFSCRTIGLFACNESCSLRVKHSGGAQALLWALQRQMQSENVVLEGCFAMCKFLEFPIHRQFFGSNGGCEIAVATLKSFHTVTKITEVCSKAIHFLALDTNNRAWLGASGGCHIIYSLKEHIDNPLLCTTVCSALSSLALHHDGNARRLCSMNGIDIILSVLKLHHRQEILVEAGTYCLFCLAEFTDIAKSLNHAGAISCILEILLYHKRQSPIAVRGFGALSRLTHPLSIEYSLLLETHIDSTVISLLEDFNNVPIEVIIPALDVLKNLSSLPDNRIVLGRNGICRLLNNIVRDHVSDVEVVKKITEILHSICFCDENINLLLNTNICDLLVLAMKEHKVDQNLCSDICHVLLQLALNQKDNLILSDSEEVVTILKHLQSVKEHESAILVVLRLLGILCSDSKISSSLIKANGIKLLSSTISSHINHIEIVRQGMSVFSSLFCRRGIDYCIDTDTFSRLTAYETCDVFGHALRTHTKDILLVKTILQILLWIIKAKISNPNSDEKIPDPGKPSPIPKPLWKKLTSMFSSGSEHHESSTHQISGSSSPSRKKLLLVDDSQMLSSRLGTARLCESLLQTVPHHFEDEQIAVDVCALLSFLSRTDENIDLIQKANGCDILFVLLKSYYASETMLLLLCPILDSLIDFSIKKNSTIVISKSLPSNGLLLGELGLSVYIIEALQLFSERVQVLLALLKLFHQLAACNNLNQSNIPRMSPNCFEVLLRILSLHYNNSSLVQKSIDTLNSILVNHDDNIARFVSSCEFSIFSKLLGHWNSELLIIRAILWLLKSVGPSAITTTASPSPSPRQAKKRLVIESWSNTDIEEYIISYFIHYCKSDRYICQYASDLLCHMLDSAPLEYSYFYSNEQIEKCKTFAAKGVIAALTTILDSYTSEEVLESTFFLAALLTRRLDNLSLRQYSMPGLSTYHDNIALMQPQSTVRTILRTLEKYPSHQGIIRSTLFLLNNLVVDHNIQTIVLSSMKVIWRAIQGSVHDRYALRYSCNLISTLASIDGAFQTKLISLGAIPVILHAFRLYVSYPQCVHDAIVAIILLCNQNPNAKEKIASTPLCEVLVDTLEAYSLNEAIAVEIARCIALLMENSPSGVCIKFNEKGLGQGIVGLLQSFGCGRESDQSAVVAEWCSRVIYCIAITPLPTITRSASSTDSHDESDHRQFQQNWALQLGNLGACETLTIVIEKFSHRKEVLLYACKALLALSAERENVLKFVQASAPKVMSLIKDIHSENAPMLMDYVNIILSRIDQVDGVEG